MSVLGVSGAADDLASLLLKFSGGLGELTDLSGADEGEVHGPEEQDHVLSFELGKRHLLEFALPPGVGSKLGSGVAYLTFVSHNLSRGFHVLAY